jgi:hypothetical protein
MGVVSRLTAAAPPGGHRRTSNPGWSRGPLPVGASRRDLPTGCARRSPEWSPGDGGSIPPTSTNLHVRPARHAHPAPAATRGATDRSAAFPRSADRIANPLVQDRRHGSHRTFGSSEARPYVVAWGRLTEEDEDRLRTRVAAPADTDVTVDLCEVEEVTDEGCVAIKNVAEDMGCRGQTMVVLYLPDREATRSLERTGLLDHGGIVFVASSPVRRVHLDA